MLGHLVPLGVEIPCIASTETPRLSTSREEVPPGASWTRPTRPQLVPERGNLSDMLVQFNNLRPGGDFLVLYALLLQGFALQIDQLVMIWGSAGCNH